jgi:NAD-dependent epimerase/dehydratase family protein
MNNVILIAGVHGVSGRAAAEHWASLPDRRVYGLSRRSAPLPAAVEAITTDLLDRDDLQRKLEPISGITHIVFGAYIEKYQITSAEILAKATAWAGQSELARNEIFNITNGDYFRWKYLWPRIAAMFDMPAADPVPTPLTVYMADKEPVWEALVRKHGLQPTPYEQVSSWPFADAILRLMEYDNITSTIKARRAGFRDCIDTEDMFKIFFASLRKDLLADSIAVGKDAPSLRRTQEGPCTRVSKHHPQGDRHFVDRFKTVSSPYRRSDSGAIASSPRAAQSLDPLQAYPQVSTRVKPSSEYEPVCFL